MTKVVLVALVIALLAVLGSAILTPPKALAWSPQKWAAGQIIKKGFESQGYVCPKKPWWLPVPSPIWYGLTCAKPVY